MKGTEHTGGGMWIQLRVPQPLQAAEWFCRELGFAILERKEHLLRIEKGNCRFLITEGADKAISGNTGVYEHVALEAADIEAALKYCRNRGMVLETDHGKPFYNPKVWGDGMDYFNILTDFGVKVEISRQTAKSPEPWNKCPVKDMEHLGVQVSDIRKSAAYYAELGFSTGWPLIENELADGGTVLCTMQKRDDVTLELYQFPGKPSPAGIGDSGIICLIFPEKGLDGGGYLSAGPDGECAVIL